MKLNDNYTLEEKRKMTGSLVHVGNFLDSSASSICTSISKGRFGSSAVELILELIAGITTLEQVKQDFENCRPKKRGRPRTKEIRTGPPRKRGRPRKGVN
jgi:hypothetical protein